MPGRLSLPILLLLWALPAAAAPSLCGHLPERGLVATSAPPETIPARPRADRTLICPPGYALDVAGRRPACARPGRASADGDPRRACRASLPIGPIAPVPAQWRPTRSCPGGAITSVIRAEGQNAGIAEVVVSSASPGVAVTTLDEDTPGLAPADRPAAQGCFAHQCRLLRLTIAADAPDTVQLRFAIADGASSSLALPLVTHCADPVARR